MEANSETATVLIQQARLRAGLKQAELARQAGIPRSVLNAYERGRRQPRADALARILSAAGFELYLRRAARELDLDRAAHILHQVLDLADSLPHRRRGELEFPPFRTLVA